MEIDYTRKANVVPTFKSEIHDNFIVHQAGLMVGVQFQLGDLLLTPEVVGMYHNGEDVDTYAFYPGLALGASW